jgi:CubicO group peptidase (beta-lactamase class C family)
MKASKIGLVGLLLAAALYAAGDAELSATGPDAAAHGAREHYPIGTRATMFDQQFLVGTFSHFDSLFPANTVLPAAQAWNFQRAPDLPDLHYMHAGSRYALSDYLAHLPVTGLFIAKDGHILYEGYQYGRTPADRLLSQSMAKSIVSMLVGIALAEHSIQSVSDPAATYIPELNGSDYGKATVQNLLHMSSGIDCNLPGEDPDSTDVKGLGSNCKQAAPAGTRFRYSAEDSSVLGLILKRATHKSLSEYLEDKIWRNIGTEAKATWTIGRSGTELPYCCFNATLRDYARFARLLAFDGNWNGKQIIPKQYLLDATSVKDSDSQLLPGRPGPFFGYGDQMWIFPGSRRMFGLLGANGQRIFVDPQSKLILVQTAVMEKAMDPSKDREMIGLWLSLVHHFGAE